MGDTKKAREVLLSKVSKYEDAYQYYLINQNKGESIRAIARKFGVNQTGLMRYIASQKSSLDSSQLSSAVEGIKGGLEVIKNLQESSLERDKQLAQKAIATLEDYYPQMKSIFASIQNRVLNALDRETQTMDSMGELTIDTIAKVQSVLKTANDTNAFIPKTPLVAVQNNISNQNIQNPTTQSKDDDVLELVLVSNKEEAKAVLEGEIVE